MDQDGNGVPSGLGDVTSNGDLTVHHPEKEKDSPEVLKYSNSNMFGTSIFFCCGESMPRRFPLEQTM